MPCEVSDSVMIPTFAIHCPEIPHRQRISDAHYREHGLNPIWFRSVHGRTWGIETTKSWDLSGHHIPPRSVGLNLGHWFLWQHLLLTDVPTALVLEDDTILVPKFLEHLDYLIRYRLQPDWEFVFVGSVNTIYPDGRKVTVR